MLKNPQLNDLVLRKNNPEVGKVIFVDNYWGRVVVDYGSVKVDYVSWNKGIESLRRLSQEERADYFLHLESTGVSDNWRDT